MHALMMSINLLINTLMITIVVFDLIMLVKKVGQADLLVGLAVF